jgi:hypothetical protein
MLRWRHEHEDPSLDWREWREGRPRRAWELKQQGWKQQDSVGRAGSNRWCGQHVARTAQAGAGDDKSAPTWSGRRTLPCIHAITD